MATHVRTADQNRRAVLFLVPTCMLVSQQAAAVRAETGLVVAAFMGGVKCPHFGSYDCLLCTPAAFVQLVDGADNHAVMTQFGLIVFDEVHHVVKKHLYRAIARRLRCLNPQPRIIGLTASMTYAVNAGIDIVFCHHVVLIDVSICVLVRSGKSNNIKCYI